MSRVLKTRFPCVDCGEACEVRRLDEGKHVRCRECSALRMEINLANWNREWASEKYEKHNGSTEFIVELAALISETIDHLSKAAQHAFRVAFILAGRNEPVKSATWVRAARSWLKRVVSLAEQLRELTANEGDVSVCLLRVGFRVIDGGLAEVPSA